MSIKEFELKAFVATVSCGGQHHKPCCTPARDGIRMPSLEAGGDVGCRNSARLPLPTTAKSSIQKHAFVFRISHAKLPQLSNGYGSAQNSALEGFGDFSILVASLFPHPPSDPGGDEFLDIRCSRHDL